ncbi:MAG TPA: hypothetical protein VFN78_10680 [Ktedonobacterales bacterium]|nr:hypothetical protein [Ktedonobacterales bacterium]
MAKKSTSGHSRPMPAHGKGSARKPQQAPERASSATLVRSTEAPSPSAANVVAETPAATPQPEPKPAPAPKPTVRKTAVAERAVAERAVAAKPASVPQAAAKASAPAATSPAPAARPPAVSTREQNVRLARARATQRARQANLISAENYAYVLGDLKLVVGLAVTAFVVLIALTFVLPH